MAEVPLPTPTQVPVPSTDIRNAVFAGAKLDEEVTGTGEFYTDRLGVKRLTNTGRTTQFNASQNERSEIFNRQLAEHEGVFESSQTDKENRFQQFLLSSGYVFLGDYENGPFQFSSRNQYIRYDNQYYRLNAATDVGFTTTGTDATSFANDVTHFVLMDGDTLRQNLGSNEGFSLIGQATYSQIRNFTGSGNSIMCCGAEARLDGGQGIFDLVPGGNAMAIPDDNCVHLRDGQGRLWKRRGVSNVIKMAWAGAKTMLETSEPQDVAFENCLQAAASLSPDGYIQSIIEGSYDAPIYLNETHYIRGGNFSESTAWEGVGKMSSRFGLLGIWAGGRVDKDILFCVQMHKPLFNFTIDNTLLDFTYENYKGKTKEEQQTIVDANRFLRLEALVNAPEFNISGINYPGTCVYSLGKSNYADVTAHWPDLNTVLPSVQNIGKAFFNFKSCGRDFYIRNNGSGLGHIQSIWSQNMMLPGHLKDLYDVNLTYENLVPHEEDTGGFIFENVGGNLGMVNVGAGGKGNLCIWDCPQLFITATTGICGGPDYARSNPDFYLIEVCNSNVTWAAVHPQNAGKFMRVGFNSRIHLLDIDGWDVSKLLEITSDISKYKYRGTRSSLTQDDTRVFVGRSFLQNLNSASLGFPCEPVITIGLC